MISDIMIGLEKKTVLSNFNGKTELTHSEIYDLVKFGLTDLLVESMKLGYFNDRSNIDALLADITSYHPKESVYLPLFKALVDEVDSELIEDINWLYYYRRMLSIDLVIAEFILKKGFVKVSDASYGIIVKNIIKGNVNKVSKIIDKYNIDVQFISGIIVGSYSYSKECFDYFILTFGIHSKLLRDMVQSHYSVEMFKYLFSKQYVPSDIDYDYIFKLSIINYNTLLPDYLVKERGIVPNNLAKTKDIATEYGLKKGDLLLLDL